MDRLYVLAAAPRGGGGAPAPRTYVFIGAQTAYVQDFDVEAGSSSVADPVVNALTTGSVLDVGVINTSEVTIVAEARAVRGALQRIVGEAPGRRTKDWTRWWESEASAPYRPSRTQRAGREGRSGSLTRPGAREESTPPSSSGRGASTSA